MRVLLHSGGAGNVPFDVEGRFLAGARNILFIGWAVHDPTPSYAWLRDRLAAADLPLVNCPVDGDAIQRLREADAILMGGGNTFLLTERLHRFGMIDAIRQAVEGGLRYVGASAGTNVACPTMCTTNDMPIIQPPTFSTLGLVPFQINVHYMDPDPSSSHRGETRAQRLAEWLIQSPVPVLGLREVSRVERDGDRLTLHGPANSILFERDKAPRDLSPGTDIDFLLG